MRVIKLQFIWEIRVLEVPYIYPASVAHIRKLLFDLLRGTPWKATLAERCLTAIDELRDEYGIVANDTRHPDVLSEIPWPAEAGPP